MHKVGFFKLELTVVCKRKMSEKENKTIPMKLDEYSQSYAIYILMHIRMAYFLIFWIIGSKMDQNRLTEAIQKFIFK